MVVNKLQGSYGSWKTWKVLEFYFPGLESPGQKVSGPGKFWKSVKLKKTFFFFNMKCMVDSTVYGELILRS